VQGGTFPAEIWKAFMEPAHAGVPVVDWDRPPPPKRANARLYLPGSECIQVPAPVVAAPVDPNAPPTTVDPAAPTTTTTIPIARTVPVGTTIPPDVLDPKAPLPFLPLTDLVGPCR
jgi:penicillin-binding protein 1A